MCTGPKGQTSKRHTVDKDIGAAIPLYNKHRTFTLEWLNWRATSVMTPNVKIILSVMIFTEILTCFSELSHCQRAQQPIKTIVWEGCHARLPQLDSNSDWLTGSLAVFQQHARQNREGMTKSALDVVWIEVILEEKPFNESLILYHFALKDQDTLCCSGVTVFSSCWCFQ